MLFCGANGIRTRDPLHAMQMRYQLRHSPKAFYTIHKGAKKCNQPVSCKQKPKSADYSNPRDKQRPDHARNQSNGSVRYHQAYRKASDASKNR